MRTITLEELLEAGCHFGHQVTRQNPRARDFIYEARDGIHIIDLAKTKQGLDAAAAIVKDFARKGGTMVVVGAKRQAQPIVAEEIKRAIEELGAKVHSGAGLFYVVNRWIGGTFTNTQEVNKNYKKLKDLTTLMHNEEERMKYTKKELGLWEKERQKLQSYYGGTADMKQLPDLIFIIDTHLEHLAVSEAQRMGIPIVGITDTNSDPNLIDYPIPSNDDAVGAIKLITHHIVDAWIEGKKLAAKGQHDEESKEQKGTDAEEVKVPQNEKNVKETKTVTKKQNSKVSEKTKRETKKASTV